MGSLVGEGQLRALHRERAGAWQQLAWSRANKGCHSTDGRQKQKWPTAPRQVRQYAGSLGAVCRRLLISGATEPPAP